MKTPSVCEYATEAIPYWKSRWVIDHLVLVAVVVAYFLAGIPGLEAALDRGLHSGLVSLGGCGQGRVLRGPPVEIFAQMSGFRELWRSARWILFAVGLTFAAILTRFVSMAAFHFQSG